MKPTTVNLVVRSCHLLFRTFVRSIKIPFESSSQRSSYRPCLSTRKHRSVSRIKSHEYVEKCGGSEIFHSVVESGTVTILFAVIAFTALSLQFIINLVAHWGGNLVLINLLRFLEYASLFAEMLYFLTRLIRKALKHVGLS